MPKAKLRSGRGQVVLGRSRRRVGVVALVLLCVTAAAALILAHRYHLGAAAILVGILGGLPGLYLAWAAVSISPSEADRVDLARVADQLAVAIGEQWQAEAAVRRLNDPYPLPVSWDAADPSLTDGWDSLVNLAGSGAGWPSPSPAEGWAAGPDGLAGAGADLVRVLARVPTGRLVVLGEPGAGKTILMIRLVLDLLTRRVGGGPVPILASVASWNPEKQDLRGWLGAQLMTDHPALANPPPAGVDEPTQAAALLAAGLIMPILDGLDEIPEGVRGPAISRINDALRPGVPLVVTCRSQQYRDVVRPKDGVEVTLRGAAAVQLCPLDADAVRSYLCDDAAGPVARARWEPVLKLLGTNAPAAQALTTPLMVGLARTIYNPRAGELAGTVRDPVELCNPLVNRAAVESLLFDAFIPAAYRQALTGRWNAQDAENWLIFLARYLGPELAWWELSRVRPDRPPPLLQIYPKVQIYLQETIEVGINLGLFQAKWTTELKLPSSAASPTTALARLRGSAIKGAALVVVPFGVLAGLLAWLVAGVVIGAGAGLVAGLVVGVVTGLATTVTLSFTMKWPRYEIARIRLALRHQLPWRLMSFLADAHKRGVLRQAGAVYQFRHIELQHRLATRSASLTIVSLRAISVPARMRQRIVIWPSRILAGIVAPAFRGRALDDVCPSKRARPIFTMDSSSCQRSGR